jgi:hypothetical protein
LPPRRTERQRGLGLALAFALAFFALCLAGCSAILESPGPPDPEAFPGIVGQMGRFGIDVQTWTSGDSGCDDSTLNPTAIRFTADGLDQATPVTLRIYIFGNRAAWDRRLADVDTCAGKWATDPATFEIVQTSPYVVAGQGPWPAGFTDALHMALTAAAGNGGSAGRGVEGP